MDNYEIVDLAPGTNQRDAVNKNQMDTELAKKLNTTDADQKLVIKNNPQVTANLDMGDN